MSLIRKGQCNRCGQCCLNRNFFINPPKAGQRCGYLEFRNGVAFCKIYENKPQVCGGFPQNPTDLRELKREIEEKGLRYKECGFYFIEKNEK